MDDVMHEALNVIGEAARVHTVERARIAKILRDFVCAPRSASSLQPVLDLAHELNPDLMREAVWPTN